MMTKNIQQIYEQFLELEDREKLFERVQINQIKIWHYIRFSIYALVTHKFGVVENPNDQEKFYKKSNTLKNWIDDNILKNQFRIGHKDVFILNHPRRMKNGKYYRCIYTDEWLRNFRRSYYVYELPYYGKYHFKPVKTKNLRYIDQEKYTHLFKRNYYDSSVSRKEARKLANYIITILENEFEILLQLDERKKILNLIIWSVVAREGLRDYYSYLLSRIKPKIIIYVVGYGLDQMILAELGRELGIPTIELQHGQIGDVHLAYNFKGNVRLNAFPQYLFVYGQYDKNKIKNHIRKEDIYVVGSPELDKKVDYYNKSISKKKKKKKIITFIAGGEYETIDSAIELSRKLDKNKFKLYLKLHPSEYTNWKRKYPNLIDSGVQVVDDSRHDIYYYLAISDFVIGVASTALNEATRFQCDIMILRRSYYYVSKDLVESGNAIYIDSMDDVLKRVENNHNKRQESDYFYCRNSYQLIYSAIDDIIDKTYKDRESK